MSWANNQLQKLSFKTNGRDREYTHGWDVPQDALDMYDHLPESETDTGWIKYYGTYYHTSDFIRFDSGTGEWDAYHTLWTGTVIVLKIIDSDTFVLGRSTAIDRILTDRENQS